MRDSERATLFTLYYRRDHCDAFDNLIPNVLKSGRHCWSSSMWRAYYIRKLFHSQHRFKSSVSKFQLLVCRDAIYLFFLYSLRYYDLSLRGNVTKFSCFCSFSWYWKLQWSDKALNPIIVIINPFSVKCCEFSFLKLWSCGQAPWILLCQMWRWTRPRQISACRMPLFLLFPCCSLSRPRKHNMASEMVIISDTGGIVQPG